MDDQHKAVRGAAEELGMSRHWSRGEDSQHEYLHDLEDLAAEVLLAMREAGIDQGVLLDVAKTIDENPLKRQIADFSGDNLEFLVREAFESRRQTVTATHPVAE